MLGYGRAVIVVIMFVVIVMVMVVMVMFVMTMLVMIMACMVMFFVVLFRGDSGAGRLGRGRVAVLRDRGVRGFAGGLFGSRHTVLRGDGIMRLVGLVARFVGCTVVSFARRVLTLGLDRALGEALRLAGIGRVGVRPIVVLRIGVVLMRLVVGLMPLGLGREACLGGLDDLALNPFAAAAASRTAVPVAAAIGAVLAFLFGFAVRALLGLDQSLPVGDRDLIIVRMDFAEGQEAVAVAAILDEGGLQRGLNAGNLGQVDVAAELLALGRFEIKFLDAVAADDNDPGLFRVGSIDQHLVGHIGTLGGDGRDWPRARGALSDDATVHLIRG
nr:MULTISPECIES: hypothetical protein [unclassified Bradyrhizobium]